MFLIGCAVKSTGSYGEEEAIRRLSQLWSSWGAQCCLLLVSVPLLAPSGDCTRNLRHIHVRSMLR